jgi:energy-coupling factor transporter ATP-binding protein EcfA2
LLTKLIIRNFKRFEEAEIDLGNPVVFIGPNNSGKTTALQALALWEIGIKRWNEKRAGKQSPDKRPGVTINRRDLIALPVPNANLLWRDLHVRDALNVDGKRSTQNIRIDITLRGISMEKEWQCGLEFDFANEESLYCRPLRLSNEDKPSRMEIPEPAGKVKMAYLPPMSGLASNETRLDAGAVNVRIGEGRTAEVLRNLCYKIHNEMTEMAPDKWEKIKTLIKTLFGSEIEPPLYVGERGEVVMSYIENGARFDLSASGRGLQQTLLLFAYMYANPGAILLLDEPDAHLEILRQRQIYRYLTETARENDNQLIISSHSEIILNEAADKDVVVAFVGSPHPIADHGSQLLKSLREIGWEHYYQAEQTGWVLYLEGSTDLSILYALSEKLEYSEAVEALAKPYVHYVGNNAQEAIRHFQGLKEAVPKLRGIAIFDRLERKPLDVMGVEILEWKKREIENYLSRPEVLEAFAGNIDTAESKGSLFDAALIDTRVKAMRSATDNISNALRTLGKGPPWDDDTKASDDFLTPLFKDYFHQIGGYNTMGKKEFHKLARFITKDEIDPEIVTKLDAIVRVARGSR